MRKNDEQTHEQVMRAGRVASGKGRQEMKEKGLLFDLDELLSKIGKDDYWTDFLKVRRMEAGVLRLRPGEEDTQVRTTTTNSTLW